MAPGRLARQANLSTDRPAFMCGEGYRGLPAQAGMLLCFSHTSVIKSVARRLRFAEADQPSRKAEYRIYAARV